MTLKTSDEFLPVDACAESVNGRKHNSQNVASYGIHHRKSDLLAWIDDEDRANGESDSLLVDVVQVLLVDHVVEESHFSVSIGNDWKLKVGLGKLVDVLDPVLVGA